MNIFTDDNEIEWPEEVREEWFDDIDDSEEFEDELETLISELEPVSFDADEFFALPSDEEEEEDIQFDTEDLKFVIAEPVVPAKAPPKSVVARAIFDVMFFTTPPHPRKDIINTFIEEVGLTKAGAATYYQNFTKSLKTK